MALLVVADFCTWVFGQGYCVLAVPLTAILYPQGD